MFPLWYERQEAKTMFESLRSKKVSCYHMKLPSGESDEWPANHLFRHLQVLPSYYHYISKVYNSYGSALLRTNLFLVH